eukprot:4309-Heterococcus_DN1.PRE.1
MDGMDKISFTSQLTQALQKLPHTSDDVEGAAIIVQALDDVKAVLSSTFPHLTAQQQQALVLLTTPAKRGGWCCDRLVSWGFKTLQGVAQTSYLRGKSNSNPKIKPVGSGSDDASATATAEQQ